MFVLRRLLCTGDTQQHDWFSPVSLKNVPPHKKSFPIFYSLLYSLLSVWALLLYRNLYFLATFRGIFTDQSDEQLQLDPGDLRMTSKLCRWRLATLKLKNCFIIYFQFVCCLRKSNSRRIIEFIAWYVSCAERYWPTVGNSYCKRFVVESTIALRIMGLEYPIFIENWDLFQGSILSTLPFTIGNSWVWLLTPEIW